MATKFDPTPQQLEAEASAERGDRVLVINAGAGAGKTSTLAHLARVFERLGLVVAYICYNASTAKEARSRFPRNTTCGTAHSFAYKAMFVKGVPYWGHRLRGNGRGFQQAKVVAKILGITEPIFVPGNTIAPESADSLALLTVKEFCKSADLELAAHHVPVPAYFDLDADDAVRAAILPLARKAWADLRARNGLANDPSAEGCLNIEHDHYLKFFQLSGRPIMVRGADGTERPADVVMLDECQDANPLMAAIFKAQGEDWTDTKTGEVTPARRLILVGDQNQAINGWNGAVNIMGDFPGATVVELTRSFRFGPAIAAEANKWLALLCADLRILGHEPVESVIDDTATEADAVLCRTNAGAMKQVLQMQREETPRKVHLVGDGEEMKALAKAAIDLDEKGWTKHPDLKGYTSWNQLVTYVENGEIGSEELATGVKLIEEFGADDVIEAIDGLATARRAEVFVCTAHKSKGLEWDRVRIADDFKQPERDKDGVEVLPGEDELMLSYVAVTRAKKVLIRGSLAWVDGWLTKHGIPVGTPAPAAVPAPREAVSMALVVPSDEPATGEVELAQARLDGAPEGLSRAVARLALIEAQAREGGRDDAARAADVRALVEDFLGREARAALAEEVMANAS